MNDTTEAIREASEGAVAMANDTVDMGTVKETVEAVKDVVDTESVKETISAAKAKAKEAANAVMGELTDTHKTGEGEAAHGGDEKPKKRGSINPQLIDPGNTAMRDSGNMNVMSGKQQGLSNGDTWHAVSSCVFTFEAGTDFLISRMAGPPRASW